MIADSGLQPNMIITRVNGQAIEDVAEFQDIYASLESGQSFRVVVRTPDGLAYVTSLTKPAENG
jgi:serine protease Do